MPLTTPLAEKSCLEKKDDTMTIEKTVRIQLQAESPKQPYTGRKCTILTLSKNVIILLIYLPTLQ